MTRQLDVFAWLRAEYKRQTRVPKFKTELARLEWEYRKAPKGRKEAAAKRLKDHRTELLRKEVESRTGKRKAA